MTVHVLVADPLREGYALPELARTSPLTEAEAVDLYRAMLKDTIRAAAESGGDLLINYPTDDRLVDDDPERLRPKAAFRSLAREVLDGDGDVRFEVQVGSSFEARAGNAATYLLAEEDVASVAILDGRAPTLARTDLDGAAMKLRRNDVVLGPSPGGRVAYLGLAEPIDFDGAYEPPALETLARRGVDANLDVDFVAMQPRVDAGDDLATLRFWINARLAAGRRVPEFTRQTIGELELRLGVEDGDPAIDRT